MILAYIDPGTGALVIQLLIAGVLGAFFYFRKAILGFFGLFKKSAPQEAAAEQKDETQGVGEQ